MKKDQISGTMSSPDQNEDDLQSPTRQTRQWGRSPIGARGSGMPKKRAGEKAVPKIHKAVQVQN